MVKKSEIENSDKAVSKKTNAKRNVVKKELKPEEGVVILACINKNFLEKLNNLAEKEGVKLVLTNEQVIHDYINNSDSVDENARMTAFLKDERNRKLAQEHAVEIWRILSKDQPIDKSNGVIFDKKSLVKSTTLSWSKADEILNMLDAFGFIKRINKNEFTFLFDLKIIREHIKSQVIFSIESLNFDIQRYKGAVEESSDIDDKEKFLSEFSSEVTKNIVF